MDRRSFLGLLGAGAAGFALDPERLLWRPGQRTFFLPTLSHINLVRAGDLVTYTWNYRYVIAGDDRGNRWAYPDAVTRVPPAARGPIGVVVQASPLIVQIAGAVNVASA